MVVFAILYLWLAFLAGGCRTESVAVDDPIAVYRERMLAEQQALEEQGTAQTDPGWLREQKDRAVIQLAGSESPQTQRESLVTQPRVPEPPAPADVLAQIPDPRDAEQVFAERLKRIEETAREERVVSQYRRVIEKAREYLAQFARPKRVELSLAECIHRALVNNYVIRREAFGPAISRTQVIEAEAAFDAVFFLDSSYANLDRPTVSELASSQSDLRSYQGGIRQLLPTGMRVQTSLGQTRTYNELTQLTAQFTTMNPAYDTTFSASLTQPLLRGFGLDYNRAGINSARVGAEISREKFAQQVRDTLLAVEQAYWQLAAARRALMIQAETVAQNWVTYDSIRERQVYDATPVQLNNSRSRWQSRVVAYVEAIKLVRDAEDTLKNLMNDPEFKLSEDVEIVPSETPFIAPLALDHFAEVRTALDRRSEIRQARLAIEQARIQTQRAKNETLPQLDLVFQYDVEGMERSADTSFDRLTTNRFRSYTVSLNFAWPIGNRGPQAAYQRARFQEHQAVVQAKLTMDAVVEEVNAAVRQLMFRYEQVPPQLDSVLAADLNLRALQARAPSVDPAYLETELSAVEQLASTRSGLLRVVTDYNTAIVQLEKAKGTLLEYNNVFISDETGGR